MRMNKQRLSAIVIILILILASVGCSYDSSDMPKLPMGVLSPDNLSTWYLDDSVSTMLTDKSSIEKQYLETLIGKMQIVDCRLKESTATIKYKLLDYDWLLSELVNPDNGLINDLSNISKLSASEKEISEYCYSITNGFIKNNELQFVEDKVEIGISDDRYSDNLYVLQYVQKFTISLEKDLLEFLETYVPSTDKLEIQNLQLEVGKYSIIPYSVPGDIQGDYTNVNSTNVAIKINNIFINADASEYLANLSKNNANLSFNGSTLIVIEYYLIATENNTIAIDRFKYFDNDKKLYSITKPKLVNLPNTMELPKAKESKQIAVMAIPTDATEVYWYDELLGLAYKVQLNVNEPSKLSESMPDESDNEKMQDMEDFDN